MSPSLFPNRNLFGYLNACKYANSIHQWEKDRVKGQSF